MSPEQARRVLRHLVADRYADRTVRGSYARLAAVDPIIDRAVSFEAKLSDARGAFVQARAHGHFADRCYVAFDSAYRARFDAIRPAYVAEGIGLIALDAAESRPRPLRRRR